MPAVGETTTVGVDLAAEAARTGLAVVAWRDSDAELQRLALGCEDDDLLRAFAGADKIGLDCPLGWPDTFVEFLNAHQSQRRLPSDRVPDKAWRRSLAYRLTDERIRADLGLIPLSVSTDRIGLVAMRGAALIDRCAPEGPELDRSGRGRIVEVYPSASLRRWGLPHRAYKRLAGRAGLDDALSQLLNAAPWLHLGAFEALVRRSDDAFDALVAALTARAAAIGHCTLPDETEEDQARREGWIVVPTGPLEKLAAS